LNKRFGWLLVAADAILAWAFAGQIGRLVGENAFSQYEEGRVMGELSAAQANAAAELSPQLPKRVDEITMLMSVTSVEESVLYHYRLDMAESEIDAQQFVSGMTSIIKKSVCGSPQMASILDVGGKYIYLYQTIDWATVGTITMSKEACAT
jgi:hypothetical protein